MSAGSRDAITKRGRTCTELLSGQKIHLALGNGSDINSCSGWCEGCSAPAVSTPGISKDPVEPVCMRSSADKSQPGLQRGVGSAVAVMGEDVLLLLMLPVSHQGGDGRM